MEKVYTDPSNPGSFTGLNTFTRALREKNIKATNIKGNTRKHKKYKI